MSLVVNDQMREFSPAWKRGLSFFITDETFALLTLGDDGLERDRPPRYLAGLMGTAYLQTFWLYMPVLGAFEPGDGTMTADIQ